MDLTALEPGYDLPALPGWAEAALFTPCLTVDLDAMERNIVRMQQLADAAGVRLRPHAKTHRSADVALRQIAAGAIGVCTQTLGGAEALAKGGVPDILITNQVRGAARCARVARLARELDREKAAQLAQPRRSSPRRRGKLLSVISSPPSSNQSPVMKWKHMPACSSVRSPERRLMVRSPQSGG